jgi:hypothetical protein
MKRFLTLLVLVVLTALVAATAARADTSISFGVATLDKSSGYVTLNATITCPAGDALFLDQVGNTLSQSVGRYAMSAPFQDPNEIDCTGSPQSYSVTVNPPLGGPHWYAGPAFVNAVFFEGESVIVVAQTVKLRS